MIGFLLVDKPGGWTSHDVVGKVRRLAGIKKVGHAGTLDPMATGLLVVALGHATRLLRFVQGLPKEYLATAQFGVATDSLDADGSVLTREPMDCTEREVAQVLDRFRGPIMQTPPMVSARKVGGKRLYELAREGKIVEREAREVTIYELELVDFAPGPYPEVELRVVCSTGTYVRTLADDIAAALGGRAHLTALRRVRNGALHVDHAHSMDDIEAAANDAEFGSKLLTPADALADLDVIDVAQEDVESIKNGRRLPVAVLGEEVRGGPFAVRAPDGSLLAVSSVTGGVLVPEVVVPS